MRVINLFPRLEDGALGLEDHAVKIKNKRTDHRVAHPEKSQEAIIMGLPDIFEGYL